MLDKNLIMDMIHDESIQRICGFKFLSALIKELETQTDKSEQVAYLEKIEEAGLVLDKLMHDRSDDEDEDYLDFLSAKINFADHNYLLDVATTEGRTPMHFLDASNLSGVMEELLVGEVFDLYELKDNQGHDAFEGREGYECRLMLEILKPQDRFAFLADNKHILSSRSGEDIVDILYGLDIEQRTHLLFFRAEGAKSVWEKLTPEAKQVLLKKETPKTQTKWRNFFNGNDFWGRSGHFRT